MLWLDRGNRRYAAGAPPVPLDVSVQPAAAVACPEDFPASLERLFGLAPGDLRLYQGDLSCASPDLLAALEWAAVDGVRIAVVFGGPALCDELEILLAPYGMTVVEAILGPNCRVRFNPRSIEALPQILKSR